MELMVLAVPGCPNAPVLEQRLVTALAGLPAATVARRVITNAAQAARWGVHGSPTLLINGQDPFAVPGAGPALACRLYPARDGRLDGAPTVAELRWALVQQSEGSWRSLIGGDEQPVFLAVLGVAILFEAVWYCVRGTNSVTAGPGTGST